MKLSVKLFIILLFILQNASAQKGFRIGPTASGFFSKPNVLDTLPNEFNFRFKGGLGGGVSMYYGFTPNFGISLNCTYISKGYRIYNDTNRFGSELKHNQSFIEIPIYLDFKQKFNSTSFVRETFGVALSTLVSTTKKELSNANGSYRIIEETNKTFNPMLDFGIEVGNETKIGNVIIFGFHYKYALNTNTILGIYNNNISTKSYFDLGFRGNYVGISVTYQFNLNNLKKEEEFFY